MFGEVLGREDLSQLEGRPGPGAHDVGHFLSHSMASSRELTSMIVKPAISSLASVKGPSVTTQSPSST